jgi:hypothetical protein
MKSSGFIKLVKKFPYLEPISYLILASLGLLSVVSKYNQMSSINELKYIEGRVISAGIDSGRTPIKNRKHTTYYLILNSSETRFEIHNEILPNNRKESLIDDLIKSSKIKVGYIENPEIDTTRITVYDLIIDDIPIQSKDKTKNNFLLETILGFLIFLLGLFWIIRFFVRRKKSSLV